MSAAVAMPTPARMPPTAGPTAAASKDKPAASPSPPPPAADATAAGAGAEAPRSASASKTAEEAKPTKACALDDVDMITGADADWHGFLGDASWARPRCVAKSDAVARPGYNSRSASEYKDTKEVMSAKVDRFIAMLRASKATAVYAGAGLSVASGIGDYASKAKGSVVRGHLNASLNRREAQPTHAHRVLASLHRKKLVHYFVNQNHDGLAQKAGFPLSKLNEIHGSWFSSKNRVKMMDDKLDQDLLHDLLVFSAKADVTVAMGTSLCGMTSDEIAEGPAWRAKAKATAGEPASAALGLVIINLQQTAMDSQASLRIFGTCDEVMEMVRRRLRLRVDKRTLDQPHWNK